jgi:D-alanine-D-alanine ligase
VVALPNLNLLISAQGILEISAGERYDVIPYQNRHQGTGFICKSLKILSLQMGLPSRWYMVRHNARDTWHYSGNILGTVRYLFSRFTWRFFGGNGTIQDLLKMLNVAFVGCSVASHPRCMDKDVTRKALALMLELTLRLCATWTHQVQKGWTSIRIAALYKTYLSVVLLGCS